MNYPQRLAASVVSDNLRRLVPSSLSEFVEIAIAVTFFDVVQVLV